MHLNIWRNQTEIEKTYTADAYDLMYGTVEDILSIVDAVDGDDVDAAALYDLVQANRDKLNDLLKDVFTGLTDEELRHIKVKELVPFFTELFGFVKKSIGAGAGDSPKN